jgi:hypothetical protein
MLPALAAPCLSSSVRRVHEGQVVRPCNIHSLLTVIVLEALVGTGCIPMHTSSHIIPPPSPAAFRDAKTGNIIPQVLVIPRYGSSAGVSTGIGEGPGSMHYESWLADPFIYREGETLTLKQPMARGVMFGPGLVWMGTSRNLHQVLVVAPGYHGRLVPLVSDQSVTGILEPTGPGESQREIVALRSALLERKRWEDCTVRFDSIDTTLVSSCFDRWLESMNAKLLPDAKTQ